MDGSRSASRSDARRPGRFRGIRCSSSGAASSSRIRYTDSDFLTDPNREFDPHARRCVERSSLRTTCSRSRRASRHASTARMRALVISASTRRRHRSPPSLWSCRKGKRRGGARNASKEAVKSSAAVSSRVSGWRSDRQHRRRLYVSGNGASGKQACAVSNPRAASKSSPSTVTESCGRSDRRRQRRRRRRHQRDAHFPLARRAGAADEHSCDDESFEEPC